MTDTGPALAPRHAPRRPALAVSRPGDEVERAADRAAEQVVGALEQSGPTRGCWPPAAAALAMVPVGIHRAAVNDATPSIRTLSEGRRGGHGQPLPTAVRALVEPQLGVDLGGVRVHTGGSESATADALDAKAYTVGRDIVFGAGQFDPATRSGRRLLAHELAHVVQQTGGHDAGGRPLVAADGGLTDQDVALIADWLGAPRPGERARWTGFPAFGGGVFPPLDQDLGPIAPAGCPGPCHQVNAAMRKQADQRAADQRAADRRARWSGLVQSQYPQDVAGQTGSLTDEIDSTGLALAQARLNLFNRVLTQQPTPGATARAGGGGDVLTPEIRDAWSQAEGLASALTALIRIDRDDVPVAVAASFRVAVRRFYAALLPGLHGLDAEDQQRSDLVKDHPCPRGCHTATPDLSPQFPALRGMGPAWPGRPPGWALPGMANAAVGPPIDAAPGPRAQRLANAVAALASAGSAEGLTAAVEEFRWAAGQMEALIRDRVLIDAASKDELEQLDYAGGLLQRQRQFAAAYPEAIRIPAVFYPHEDVNVTVGDFGEPDRESARAIPWEFYLVRTPVSADNRGYQWELHDITAPKQGRPKIVVARRLDDLGVLTQQRTLQKLGKTLADIDVLPQLFEQLDHPDYFPEGVLRWYSPISKQFASTTTHARTPFGDWLVRIGMTIAILGSLVFAPFSTPMLVSAAVGTGLMVAGRAIRLDEKRRHGVLQEGDVRRFFWELAMDVVSAVTLGFGRVVAASGQVGAALRASRAANAYFLLKRVEVGTQLLNIGIITDDFIMQFAAIRNSAMTDEQKTAAYISLAQSGFATGILTIVPLRSAVKHLDQLPRLRIARDPDGRPVGDAELIPEDPGHAAAARRPAVVVHEQAIRTASGETHTFALWSDGRITRCSPRPCGLVTDSVIGRVEELQERALSDSAHLAGMDELLVRARQLRDEAARVAALPGARVQETAPDLLGKAKRLELEIEAMEGRVAQENVASERIGREEARLRFGDRALQHGPHYRWELRKDGLRLQRRTSAVPWLEFRDGSFHVAKPLFVGVAEGELARIRSTSTTRDFPVRATVATRAALDRVRPVTAVRATPKDWVVVKIDDNNLIEFMDEPIRAGVIYEYPDGSRAWRTARNTIATEGKVRPPIGRRGFEKGLPLPTAEGGGVDLTATGVAHQRSHPAGDITGFEITGHIPYAPTFVNQQLQARGIEMYVRELSAAFPELDVRLVTEHAKIPGTLRQDWIDYTVVAAGSGPPRNLLKARITTDYANPARPARVELEVRATEPADLDRMLDIDMPEARAALERKITAARGRRR